MNIYLDDNRKGPSNEFDNTQEGWENWVIVRSVENAKLLLKAGLVENLSLDHDLGIDADKIELPNGSDLVKFMIGENCWPTGEITIHSQNLIAAQQMKADIDRFRPTQNPSVTWVDGDEPELDEEPTTGIETSKCRCGGKATEEIHPCPFAEDVHNDDSDCCYCCEGCQEQCARDI